MNWLRYCRPLLLILVQLLTAHHHLFADSVDDYIRDQMNLRHIRGLVLLVLKDGRVIKQQSYGLANVELGVPTSKDSVFPLASVTKIFTSTAVYLLVQEHKIRLDNRVTQLLPGLPKSWNEVTVLNCLSHTSGITDIFPGSPAAAPANWIAAASNQEALTRVAEVPLLYKPGEKSSYNQTEFFVVKDDCREGVWHTAGGVPEQSHLQASRYVIRPLRRFTRHRSKPRGALHGFHSSSRPFSCGTAAEW
jgi:hypothetical protein